ncbi:hypothetical protein Q9R29_01655 [Rothia sp. ARF10]|nr:hypothetical protein [Rothia sp. ARF10]
MTSRGSVLSTRRLPRVLAPLLLATLALGACSDDEPTTAPSTTPSPSVSDSPSETPSESPSATPTVTETPTPTPTPSATPTTAAPSPSPTPTRSSTCAAAKVGPANVAGMSAAAATKAKKISEAARECDAQTLITLARADGTGLAGDKPAASVFTSQAGSSYVALAILLSMQPTESFDGTIQPRVFSEQYAQNDAEWDKVVKAGLITRAQATTMRQTDGGYTGYRVGLAEDGTWTFFTTGR